MPDNLPDWIKWGSGLIAGAGAGLLAAYGKVRITMARMQKIRQRTEDDAASRAAALRKNDFDFLSDYFRQTILDLTERNRVMFEQRVELETRLAIQEKENAHLAKEVDDQASQMLLLQREIEGLRHKDTP